MKTGLILGAVFVVAIAVIGYAFISAPQDAPTVSTAPQSISSTTPANPASPSSPTSSSTQPTQPQSGYTMADVAQHNSASSCWTAINGKVYDVTTWISQHPGGPEHILPLCGTDGSSAFNGQHAGQGAPAAELASFYIGALTQ